MKVYTSFEGGEDLARNVMALGSAVKERKMAIAALLKAGEPMRARMAANAPREPGAPDLADNMVISIVNQIGSPQGGKWRKREEGEHAVAVGPAKGFFYGLHQEYGTSRHGAQPFARPAFDATAPQALGIIRDELWAALRKAAPKVQTLPGSRGLL